MFLERRESLKWTGVEPGVLAAWVAEMDVDVPPPVAAALHAAVDAGATGYPVPEHLSGLPEATAHWCRTAYGWPVGAGRVRLVPDVLAGVALALTALDPERGPVVVPTPAYPPFFPRVAGTGRRVVEVPLARDGRRYALDVDAIDAALAAGARTVLLCQPHNPTGTVFGPEELTVLAAVVDRRGARVVSDEVHAPLTHPGHRHTPYATVAPGHTATVLSASKGWNLPGLKCAQVVLTAEGDAARWEAVHETELSVSPLGVAAQRAAYVEGGPWLAALHDALAVNRALLDRLLAERLPGLVPAASGATYLTWLDCTATGLADPAGFFLDEARVALGDGAHFGAVGRGHVRLNHATAPTVLTEIVERMAGALSRRRAGPRAG